MKRYRTVAALLASPKRWTKRAYARNARSRCADVDGPNATRFCLTGAIDRVYPGAVQSNNAHMKVCDILCARLLPNSAILFNDSPRTKHSDILSVVKAAGI